MQEHIRAWDWNILVQDAAAVLDKRAGRSRTITIAWLINIRPTSGIASRVSG